MYAAYALLSAAFVSDWIRIWYPPLVTALAGATVRARCTVAQLRTVLLEPSLELLWNTPRFVLGASSSERVLVA